MRKDGKHSMSPWFESDVEEAANGRRDGIDKDDDGGHFIWQLDVTEIGVEVFRLPSRFATSCDGKDTM